jgi:hypothetical protein
MNHPVVAFPIIWLVIALTLAPLVRAGFAKELGGTPPWKEAICACILAWPIMLIALILKSFKG